MSIHWIDIDKNISGKEINNMDKRYTKDEIKTICNEVAREMHQQYPAMNMGDLQSVAQFIQILETKLTK
jgi:hypothetical protein